MLADAVIRALRSSELPAVRFMSSRWIRLIRGRSLGYGTCPGAGADPAALRQIRSVSSGQAYASVKHSAVQYRGMHQAKMSMSRWPDQRLLFRICFLGDHASRGFADQDQGEGASAPLGTFGEPCCLNRVISFFAWEFQ